MGQKVNPVGMRIGIIRDWETRWYAGKKDFSVYLLEDIKIREVLGKKLHEAALSFVEIERNKEVVNVFAHVAKTGIALGQDNSRINDMTKAVKKIVGDKKVKITIVEVKHPDLDARLIAQLMAQQLEQRTSFRTVQKRAIARVMKAGAKGIKTEVSGRLAGADIARSEGYAEGIVPLHTLRADIDYAVAEAHTTYGRMGVKVWICRGEILPGKKVETKGE